MPKARITDDYIGLRFGKWVALEKTKLRRTLAWVCKCDCGTIRTVMHNSLKDGRSRSCGCEHHKAIKAAAMANRKHGMRHTRFYALHRGMMMRCYREETNGYQNYGGRGIKVCDRWHKFENFMTDMYESYYEHAKNHGEKDTTLERCDSNADYSPENCRWATNLEQHNNTRANRYFVIDGKKQSLADICRSKNLRYSTINNRIYYGWSIEEAIRGVRNA